MVTAVIHPVTERPTERALGFSLSWVREQGYIKMPQDTEDRLKRIQNCAGVSGVLIVNSEGIPIRTTMDNSTSVQYANHLTNLVTMARSCVRDIDPQDDLTFLRIRTKKNEIMLTPEKDCVLIVIQSTNS